eukprot:3466339-Prymnesium_polylepis.3
MGETFGGPGEDGVTVMRFDRSIETGSALYKAFIPYALVMMVLYPIGAMRDRTRSLAPAFMLRGLPTEPWVWSLYGRYSCAICRDAYAAGSQDPWAVNSIPIKSFDQSLDPCSAVYRNRNELNELRILEMTIEAEYALAKLEAEGANSEEEAKETMRKADAAYEEGHAAYAQLRSELPTDLRKLTAGCVPLGPRTERGRRSYTHPNRTRRPDR